MLTSERLQYLANLLPEDVSWGDPLNAVMLDQILSAHSAGAREPVAQWQYRFFDGVKWVDWANCTELLMKHKDGRDDFQFRALFARAHPQPMTQTDVARERPSVVLAYSTKGHNKPCGQTMGANGCGEFVTVYYGDIDAAERSARDRICSLEKAGHHFNWAIVMRADEEAYRGPAMTFEEIERLDQAKGE